MTRGPDSTRRGFLKALGVTGEEALMGGGLLAGLGFYGKERMESDQYRESTVNTPGFGAKATEKLLEKTAEGEPQQIGAYLLAEGHDTDFSEYEAQDFNWDQVTDQAEEYLSEIHQKIDPEISFENITPEQIAERTDRTVPEARGHLEAMKKPGIMPGYTTIDANNFHDHLEALDIGDHDAEIYLSDFGAIGHGLALPSFGEAYLDTSGLDEQQMAAFGVAHELGHLYGLDDTYMPLFTSGEGLMGADHEDVEPSQGTVEAFEKILQKF